MSNLLRLSKIDEIPGFPFRKSTLYKWVHVRKHPEIFVRIGGAVFLDLDAFNALVEKGRCHA